MEKGTNRQRIAPQPKMGTHLHASIKPTRDPKKTMDIAQGKEAKPQHHNEGTRDQPTPSPCYTVHKGQKSPLKSNLFSRLSVVDTFPAITNQHLWGRKAPPNIQARET